MSEGSRYGQWGNWMLAAIMAVNAAFAAWAALPTSQPATRPAAVPTTQRDLGPDIVIMKELVNLYEPVPFDHKTHAKMAEMWDGCVTCHHRPPTATTLPAGTTRPAGNGTALAAATQAMSAEIPACKSCHAVNGGADDIAMPNLKGAYHRQCLNCHKEWMHGNACVICHQARDPKLAATTLPTRGDIVGRMHPPIPEPDSKPYRARYTPAAGPNVLFRHKEHTKDFGLTCVQCHRKDNCAHCHDPQGRKPEQKILKPGMTWAESHGPCMNCHVGDRCAHCHYKDGEETPKAFAHTGMTGQILDKDHVHLGCGQCHTDVEFKATPTCGDSSCHKSRLMTWPQDLPGPKPATRPTIPVKGRTPKLPKPAVARPGSAQ